MLTPTRELAQQVGKAAVDFGRALPRCRTVCITGGESYITQNKALAGSYDILVATPGRLMDQINSGRIVLSNLEVLVLDEADRMLDMGFADDVMAIAKKLPKERQTVCFTATLSDDVQRMSRQLQNDPQTIAVAKPAAARLQIDQHVFYVDDIGHKRRLLDHWLADVGINQALVFTSTKVAAEELAASLEADGHSTVALHGDLPQKHRTRMMNVMRRGQARILVATDVAARGLDVPAITHVFNFDLPKFAEDYVHRIGRTGRAGASGTAISFVNRNDVLALQKIERFIGHKVNVSTVTGMEARFKPGIGKPARPAGKPGGKFSGKAASANPACGKAPVRARSAVAEPQTCAPHATPIRPIQRPVSTPGLLFEKAAQHPRGLLVNIQPLRQHIGGRLVVGLVHQREEFACGTRRRFLRVDQQADHLGGLGHAVHFLDRGELDELLVGAGGGMAQRADAFGDDVERVPLLGVLPHEHQVQGVEHRAGDVPVEIVRHQVERVAVGEQVRQALGDPGAIGVGNADVDAGWFSCFHAALLR